MIALARRDHPHALERPAAVLGEPGAVGLLPRAVRTVGPVYARSDLRVGDAREVQAGARIADRELDVAARERTGHDVHLALAVSTKDEQPLARADQQLRLGPAGHGADDLQP